MDKIYIPLSCGVGLYEKDKLCVAIVDCQGCKKVGGRFINPKSSLFDKPFLRGLGFFFNYLVLLIMSLEIASGLEKRGEKEKKTLLSSWVFLVVGCIILAFLLGLCGFGILPKYLIERIYMGDDWLFKNFLVSLTRVALIVIVLFLFKFLPSFSLLYAFNFQAHADKSGNMREVSPLNFLNLTLNSFIFSTFVITLFGVKINVFADFLINLLIILFTISIVYEVLLILSKSKSGFSKDLALVSNFLVLSRPGLTQKEVLKVAQLEMKNKDFQIEESGRVSLSSVYAEMENKLAEADKFEQSDVDWIVATVLGLNRAEVKLVRQVSEKEYRDIMRVTDRRAKGEPLSSIFGFVEFYGLRFAVNKKVLSPRMETEILVEEATKKIKENGFKNVLDLCTGSGAIAICLALFTDASVCGVDISKQALAVAEENAIKNHAKVEFLQSDLFGELKKRKKYDIIVSNPPYIKSDDILSLDEEVKKYDPRIALDGGEDGLDFYRKIVKEAPLHLESNGWLFLELGIGQAGDVEKLMQEEGFVDIVIKKDYNKIERIIYGRTSK